MSDAMNGCSPAGVVADRAAELRRQARLVDDVYERIVAIRRALPHAGDLAGWRGPAADVFASAVAEHEAVLGREVTRLDGVRSHLLAAAALADAEAIARGGMP